MGRPFLQPLQTTLDAAGNGSVTFTARESLQVTHTRVEVSPLPGQVRPVARARVMLVVNGWPMEGTYSGSGDQSDTKHPILAGESIECRWTGGDPGARAALIVRGVTV